MSADSGVADGDAGGGEAFLSLDVDGGSESDVLGEELMETGVCGFLRGVLVERLGSFATFALLGFGVAAVGGWRRLAM